MTGLAPLSKLLQVQRHYLNYSETGENQNVFAPRCRPPQQNGLAWCASFQCETHDEAGAPLLHESAGAGELLRAYHDAGKSGIEAKVGALYGLAFQGESSAGRFMGINHVGDIEQVRPDKPGGKVLIGPDGTLTGGSIVGFEGNTNFAGSRSGGMVLRKVRRANFALFGYVDFGPEPNALVSNPYVGHAAVCELGTKGARVQFVSWALDRAHVRFTFDDALLHAVIAFQRLHPECGRIDGKVGPKTLAVLKRVKHTA